MDIATFYQLTPGEFEEIYSSWAEKKRGENKREEEKHRVQWEQIRYLAYNIYLTNPNIKRKVSITDFMGFTWEKKKKEGKPPIVKNQERFETLKKKYGATI